MWTAELRFEPRQAVTRKARCFPVDLCHVIDTRLPELGRAGARSIRVLSEPERQELAREVLPWLLTTRAGLAEIDRSLEALSDEELDATIERARQRASTLGDEAVAAIIDEAVRTASPPEGRPRSHPEPHGPHLRGVARRPVRPPRL
jgi:hypothetical protein